MHHPLSSLLTLHSLHLIRLSKSPKRDASRSQGHPVQTWMQRLDAERYCPCVRLLLLSTSAHQHSHFPKKSTRVWGDHPTATHKSTPATHVAIHVAIQGVSDAGLWCCQHIAGAWLFAALFIQAGRAARRAAVHMSDSHRRAAVRVCVQLQPPSRAHTSEALALSEDLKQPQPGRVQPSQVGVRSRQQLPMRHANRPQAAAVAHAQAVAAAAAHAGAAQTRKSMSWLRACHIPAGSQSLAVCGPFCVGARGGQQRLVPHVKLPQAAAVAHARQQLQRLPVQVPDAASRR